jgi:hypothetical protein
LQTEIARLQIERRTTAAARRSLNRSKRENLLLIHKSNSRGRENLSTCWTAASLGWHLKRLAHSKRLALWRCLSLFFSLPNEEA